MRREYISKILATLGAMALASSGLAQTSVDVEAGYRWVSISGNEQEYRSQIDERDGLFVRHLSLIAAPGAFGPLFDHFTLVADDMGSSPTGAVRLDTGRNQAYRLRVRWSRTELYSALPRFDNPVLDSGVIPGEHTWSRLRNVVDADLELLPGHAITPILGYTLNRYYGPGTGTYTVGGNEFRLDDNTSDTDQEFRVGAAFHAGTFAGEVTQGWRSAHYHDTADLAPGAGSGNNSGTVLGVPVTLDGLARGTRSDTNTPVTRAFVTGTVVSGLRLTGSYTRAWAESDTNETEDLSGSLVSFELARYFGSLSEIDATRAKNHAWRASGRAEYAVTDRINVSAGYEAVHRELDGFALVSDLFGDTTTYTGQDPRDLLNLVEAHTAMERTDHTADVLVTARPVDAVALRAGFTQTKEDLTVTEDPTEIVVPGSQGGDFNRRVRAWFGGATVTYGGVTLGGEYRKENADDAILRTDFRDRERYRLRAAWRFQKWLTLSANGEQTDIFNDGTGVGYNARLRQYGGELSVSPWTPLQLQVGSDVYQADSKILIRQPQDFSIMTSLHTENGKSQEASALLDLKPVHLDAGWGRLTNDGVYPFQINRLHGRLGWDMSANLSAYGEWWRDKFSENLSGLPRYGNFSADRYAVSVRWRQ